jgi:hypothetical protein
MSSRRSSRRRETVKAKQNGKKRVKKSSKSTQKLKRVRKAQNQHKSSKSTLPPEINSP